LVQKRSYEYEERVYLWGLTLGNLEYTREPIKDTIEPPPADGLILPGANNEQIDKERVKSISYRFRVGFADRIGLRDSMEDKIVICGNFRNRPDEDYFAIFDGHAGKEASAYCAENMHIFLESQLNEQQVNGHDIPHCITQTFKMTHERMKTHTEEGKSIESGTTSLIALFKGNDLFIANAGDSRAVFFVKIKIRYWLQKIINPHLSVKRSESFQYLEEWSSKTAFKAN